MTIAPINAGGWNPQDPLTSAQVNDFQAKLLGLSTDTEATQSDLDDAENDIVQLQTDVNAVEATALDLRTYLPEVADKPEQYFHLVEDFPGAIWTPGEARLDASFPWRTGGDTSVVSVSGRGGTLRHPGVLDVAIPGNNTDLPFYFQLGLPSATPFLFNQIQRTTLVLRLEDHVSNLNTAVRIGFVQNNALFNGGTDALAFYYLKGSNAVTWYLHRRKASVSAALVALGTMTDGLYATLQFRKQTNGSVNVYFNAATLPAANIPSADLPIVGCNFGCYTSCSSADAHVFTTSIDYIALRTVAGDRSGT